jgi:hypothetical protein
MNFVFMVKGYTCSSDLNPRPGEKYTARVTVKTNTKCQFVWLVRCLHNCGQYALCHVTVCKVSVWVVTCLSVWEKCPVCQCVSSVGCYCVSPCMCLNNIRYVTSTLCLSVYVLCGMPCVLWVSVCYCLSCVLCVGACHFLCLRCAMCVSRMLCVSLCGSCPVCIVSVVYCV